MRTLGLALATMAAAQLLDLITFSVMVHRVGLEAEANPLVATLFESRGLPGVATAKVVLLAIVSSVAAILVAPPTHVRLARAVVGLGILIGLVGGVSNAVVLGAI